MNVRTIRLCLALLPLILFGMAGCGGNVSARLDQIEAKLDSLISDSARLQAMEVQLDSVLDETTRLKRMEVQLDSLFDEAARLKRMEVQLDYLIGDPAESRKQLVELRNTLEHVSVDELSQFSEQKAQLSDSLPVLAGIELSGEIAELDWLLVVRQSVLENPNIVGLLDTEMLLAEVPSGLKDIASDLASAHARQAILLAKEMAESESQEIDDLQSMLGLLERLKSANDLPGEDLLALIQSLQAKLQSLADQQISSYLESEVHSLKTQFENISKIEDEASKRLALATLSQTVQGIRIRLVLEDKIELESPFAELESQLNERLEESIHAMEMAQVERLNKARMKYQAWALGNIQQMEASLKNGSPQVKHDAAVKYLLPVNSNLLEPPVARFYSKAFEATWNAIEKEGDMQLSLARKTAEVPGRTLESFMEDGK